MHPESNDRVFLGTRELIMLTGALLALLAGVVVLALGIQRFNANRNQSELPTLSPTDAVVANDPTISASIGDHQNASTGEQAAGPTPTATTSAEVITHIVSSNENLGSIAALYNVDVASIRAANNLGENSFIQVNQALFVPISPERTTRHQVGFGETISTIATLYGVTPQIVQMANGILDPNAIFQGQTLVIVLPPGETAPTVEPTMTPTVPVVVDEGGETVDGPLQIDWARSILSGDIAANYPLTYESPRFTLHYQPGSATDLDTEGTAALVQTALELVEDQLDVRLDGVFDLYLAGTLFENPNPHLRGYSQSADRRIFLLYDGSGSYEENLYFIAHEITHLVTWNVWGSPSSTMISEGVATWAGRPALEDAGYLPYTDLCRAALEADQLPSMAAIENDWQQFRGHIRSRYSYFGSACFTDYLIEQYGMEALAELYHRSNYVDLYGQSLTTLDAEWRASLAGGSETSSEDLAAYTTEVRVAYAYIFGSYNGSERVHRGYVAVDKARSALWRGDYEDARYWLDQMYSITGFSPQG